MNEIYFQYFFKETDLNHLNNLLFKKCNCLFSLTTEIKMNAYNQQAKGIVR
jgi:hypothetical protein